jgi:hypothetical protein
MQARAVRQACGNLPSVAHRLVSAPLLAASLTFSSTSRVRAIAAEFTMKKGFVHVLRCFPGCRVFDMESASPAQREREVVLLPGSTFVRRRRRGQTVYWDVRL